MCCWRVHQTPPLAFAPRWRVRSHYEHYTLPWSELLCAASACIVVGVAQMQAGWLLYYIRI